MLPQIPDTILEDYMNYYLMPSFILTKTDKQGEVLTMGHVELNQRDSFWTSWLHLVFFNSLEKR